MGLIEKLTKIQTEMAAPKGQYNSFGKYAYRKAEDILTAVKPFLKELGCAVVVTERFIEFGAVGTIESTATLIDNETGESTSATAIAGVEKAGGMQLPQAFGSASSYAKKYALGNLFALDNEDDADATNTHGKQPAGHKLAQEVAAGGKASLTPTHKNWAAVVAKVASGTTVETIKGHYKLTAANEKKLLAEAGKA